VVADVTDLHKSFGKLEVLRGIDFRMERGEKVAFVGKNGEGKTTFSKILAGTEPFDSGICNMGHNVAIGYFAQHQADSLGGNDTLLEVIEARATGEMRSRSRALLGAFLFSGDDVYKKVKVLSGGEKARLAMAILLLEPVNFLILDEPTNHLDMISKDILKQAVREYPGTAIIVSHDREFLEGLTDKVYEFKGGKVREYLGDIRYFLSKVQIESLDQLKGSKDSLKQEPQKALASKPSGPEKEDFGARKAREKAERKLRNGIGKAERTIAELEEKVKAMEAEINNPDFYTSAKDPNRTFSEYNHLKKDLDKVMEEWAALQEKLEKMGATQ
jgi:ATP-binding cassette, subfamily F, member 3